MQYQQLLFNWRLGRDIVEMHVEDRWGEKVITQLSKDLQQALPGVEGLSRSNIYYCKSFYLLYNQDAEIVQQVVGQLEAKTNTNASEIVHQVVGQFASNVIVQQVIGLFQIPKNNWGTICTLVELVSSDGKKHKEMTADQKGMFRIIQSIPSPKAEPFKQWMAHG